MVDPIARSPCVLPLLCTSVFLQAMAKVPPKSSKWVDINRDLTAARSIQPQGPSMGVDSSTLAQGDNVLLKTKATS